MGILGRAVKCVQPKRRIAGCVHNVVLDTGRDHDGAAILERTLLSLHSYDTGTGLDTNEVVVPLMCLEAPSLRAAGFHGKGPCPSEAGGVDAMRGQVLCGPYLARGRRAPASGHGPWSHPSFGDGGPLGIPGFPVPNNLEVQV